MKKRNNHIIVGSFLCVFIVLFGFSCNTLLLNKTLNDVAKNYLSDNNRQLAAHISYRLKAGNEFVSDFADTIGRMPDFLLTEDLLARKTEAMELEGIAILSQDTVTLSSGEVPELTLWAAEHPQIWKKSLTSYIKDSCILYSSPIVKDGTTQQVVVGIQSYQDIQNLANRVHYQKDGISILLDTETREHIMLEKGSELSVKDEEITEILNHLDEKEYRHKTKVQHAFVSSESVDGTDWMQISIIPAGVLSAEMAEYIVIYFCLIAAGFLTLVVGAYYFKKSVRKKEKNLMSDSLTEGYNREGFLKAGARLVEENGLSSYAIVCLNVCDFRHINEMWGEESGNKMLRFIYHTLAEHITEKELVCRSDMDRFILLFREDRETEISARIRHLISEMNEVIPGEFGGYTLEFTVGSSRLDVAKNLNSAINNSFYVGKQAQEKNRCVFYNEETAKKISEENQLNDIFEESVKNRDFKVYLQPKVSPGQKAPCEAEALVRWQHPEKGMIYPNQFIPMFEKNGKISILDLYMFEEVCRLVARWISTGQTVTKISVNISRYHLKNNGMDVWKQYKEIKEKYKIPDGIIEIELTETMLVDRTHLSFVKLVLDRFRSCGLHVALDDFGFAYSSLALLKEFEVDTLKLDKSFFRNETVKSRKIVANIIRLAHNLNMCVVAEGIEAEEQVTALCRSNCDFIQGYVYSCPLSVEDFEKWRADYEK